MGAMLILLSVVFHVNLFPAIQEGVVELLILHSQLEKMQSAASAPALKLIQDSIEKYYKNNELQEKIFTTLTQQWGKLRDEVQTSINKSIDYIVTPAQIAQFCKQEFSGTLSFTKNYADQGPGNDLRNLLICEHTIKSLQRDSSKNPQIRKQLEDELQKTLSEIATFKESIILSFKIKLLKAQRQNLAGAKNPEDVNMLFQLNSVLTPLLPEETRRIFEGVHPLAENILFSLKDKKQFWKMDPEIISEGQLHKDFKINDYAAYCTPLDITNNGDVYFFYEFNKEDNKGITIFELDRFRKKGSQLAHFRGGEKEKGIAKQSSMVIFQNLGEYPPQYAFFDPSTRTLRTIPYRPLAISADGQVKLVKSKAHQPLLIRKSDDASRDISLKSILEGKTLEVVHAALDRVGTCIVTIQREQTERGTQEKRYLIIYNGITGEVIWHAYFQSRIFQVDVSQDGGLAAAVMVSQEEKKSLAIIWGIKNRNVIASILISAEQDINNIQVQFTHDEQGTGNGIIVLLSYANKLSSIKFIALNGILRGKEWFDIGHAEYMPVAKNLSNITSFKSSPNGAWLTGQTGEQFNTYIWHLPGILFLQSLQQAVYDAYEKRIPLRLDQDWYATLQQVKKDPAFTIPEQWDK